MRVLDVPAVQPSPAPRPPYDPDWRDEELDLLAPVVFAWRHRYLVLGLTLLAAALGFAATLLMPVPYTASTILFLNAPKSPNPLAPEPLGIDAVERLAVASGMQARVSADLEKRNLLDGDRRLLDFRAAGFTSGQVGSAPLPMIALHVDATSPELARDAANVWAAALTEDVGRLSAATRASAADFIVTEYPEASKRLHAQELTVEQTRRAQARALGSTRTTAAVSLREAQLWSREQLIVDLEAERHNLLVDIKEAEATVSALEQELKKTPQTIAVSKSISDDVILNNAAGAGGNSVPANTAKIQLQEVNPVHTTISQQLADARVKRNELAARRPALETQLGEAHREAATIRASLLAGERAVADLEHEQRIDLGLRERDAEAARQAVKKLEESIGNALLVTGGVQASLNLTSPAEAPREPSGPDRLKYVLTAGVLGFVLALFAAWVGERLRKDYATA